MRVGAMGDVLHALPAAAALRQTWPQAQIDWVVDPRWAPLLVGVTGQGPIVSAMHTAETRLWSQAPLSLRTARSVLQLRRAIRAQAYDAVVDLQGTLRSAILGSFAGRGSLVGYADPREAVATFFYGREVQRRGTHVVEQGAALLGEALGLALTPQFPELPRNEEAERWVDSLLATLPRHERIALLAPTAGWGAKQWPAARYAELSRALETKGWTVLVNAPCPDDATAVAVVQQSRGAAELVPSSLTQLIALLRRTHMSLGGDSGPVHLAAALGTPLVALFGPTDPARNGPWGPGRTAVLREASSVTSYKRVGTTDPGLERLTVSQVLEAVESITRP